MAKRAPIVPVAVRGLSPHEVVRKYAGGKKYFGYEKTALNEKIKLGLIPPTAPASPGGRAQIWTGAQILAHYGLLPTRK
jgi:hypothetical protein